MFLVFFLPVLHRSPIMSVRCGTMPFNVSQIDVLGLPITVGFRSAAVSTALTIEPVPGTTPYFDGKRSSVFVAMNKISGSFK